MRLRLTRIGAIALAELRMSWRRRALLVITLGTLVIPVGVALIMRSQLEGVRLLPDGAHRIALAVVPSSWFALFITLLLMFPLTVSDIIAKDDGLGVRDLLSAMPITSGTYVTGKLVAAWVSVLSAVAVLMFASGVLWWLMLGPFDLAPFLQMWLFGAAPLVLMNCGLAALLSGIVTTPRLAIGIGVLFVIATLFMLMGSLLPGKAAYTLWDNFNFGRGAFLWYFASLGTPQIQINYQANPVTQADILQTIALGLGQVALLALIVWGWLRRRFGN